MYCIVNWIHKAQIHFHYFFNTVFISCNVCHTAAVWFPLIASCFHHCVQYIFIIKQYETIRVSAPARAIVPYRAEKDTKISFKLFLNKASLPLLYKEYNIISKQHLYKRKCTRQERLMRHFRGLA